MANLKLNHIYKVYPNGVKAVNDFSMDIADKEFIVFIGPSGCGKSTTLKMIAGLEEITAGELCIGDTVVNDVEPKERDIAMVFQNYALYPNMTVYENMAFGLKLRKMPKEEIDKKVREAARILGITEYLDRKPKAMSGGQRQRVALGRAIVREPKVFLLDEPLSNLDAKLRTAMRAEISKLHRKLQTTFIYVTHDQVEAMTMGTRIVVMKDGFVQQIDSPRNLYNFPCNKFVAGFIGTPQMNFFKGKLLKRGDKVTVSFDDTDVKLTASASIFNKAKAEYLDGERPVTIGLRAEHISVDAKQYPYKAKCRVSHIEELGADCQVYADFNAENGDGVGESPTRVIIKAPAGSFYEADQMIEVSMDLTRIHVFDAETEETIAPRVPAEVSAAASVKGAKLTLAGAEIELPEAIKLPSGKYEVIIPTSAVALGGDIAAEVTDTEQVNDKKLIYLNADGKALFALADMDAKIGKTENISIDLKQLTFVSGGQTVAAALNCVNSLKGKITKEKIVVEKEVKGKIKKVKDYAFSLECCGASFECSRSLAIRLINGGGQDVFNKDLEFRFSPYDVIISEQGIDASVESIIDYGKESFAVCKAGDAAVNVSVPHGFGLTNVKLALDVEKLAVVEVARSIRLA